MPILLVHKTACHRKSLVFIWPILSNQSDIWMLRWDHYVAIRKLTSSYFSFSLFSETRFHPHMDDCVKKIAKFDAGSIAFTSSMWLPSRDFAWKLVTRFHIALEGVCHEMKPVYCSIKSDSLGALPTLVRREWVVQITENCEIIFQFLPLYILYEYSAYNSLIFNSA